MKGALLTGLILWGGGLVHGIEFREVGPLRASQTIRSIKVGPVSYWPSYRIQTFGEAELEIRTSKSGLRFQFEGPFESAEELDLRPLGKQKRHSLSEFNWSAHGPSLFRVSFYGSDGASAYLTCKGRCARRSLELSQLSASVEDTRQLDTITQALSLVLDKTLVDPSEKRRLLSKLSGVVDLRSPSRFPVLPPVYQMRPSREDILYLERLLQSNGAVEAAHDLQTEWDRIERCDFNRKESQSAAKEILPGVLYGHYDDDRLSRCFMAQSIRLALILTRLANGDKSPIVTVTGKTLAQPPDVIEHLIRTGHRVEMSDERTYANLLSFRFSIDGEPVETKIPVWLNTGILMPSEKPLVVPLGHSQHSWLVWGPQVNAKVAFFLGVGGVGFFPAIDARPDWTGMKKTDTVGSDTHGARVIDAVNAASDFIDLNRQERHGLPRDGYAVLGVCNDSNAFIEARLGSAVTTYPNIRMEKFDRLQRAQEFSATFAKIPRDSETTGAELNRNTRLRDQTLCRILQMSPHPVGSPHFPDDLLRDQMAEIASFDGVRELCAIGR